ncbi:V-type proton ATPase subunit S1-like [Hylaeus anthracinus]|uniref:V-type proton ATPase subunit S1-like n=1 Tax=Hylaeus anthracinus TaxID=313031 RepID=UPI0023B9324A|nr:V-type proton ATPase subunit S1-like [Hylaeus anthracinus]
MTQFRSVFSFVLTLIVVSQISSLHAENAVPVLLWGGLADTDSETSAVNPFLKTSSKEFDLFLRKKLETSPPVLLYVKDNLCVEDLVKHKQNLHTVATGDSLKYFPAVEKAVNVVEDLPSYNQTYDDYTDSKSEGQLSIMPITNLDIVPETYKTIKESSPNLIAILTGRSCSYSRSERVKRDTSTLSSNSSAFIASSERILLYSSQALSLKLVDVINLPLKHTSIQEGQGTKESPLVLKLLFNETDSSAIKHILHFKFEVKSTGYYTLKTVIYEGINYKIKDSTNHSLTTYTDIVFPFNFSYHCSQNVIFEQNSTILNIIDLQVQIDAKAFKNGKAFSDAYDCVGFTTIPIWTGIFVTAILALIMIWALTMIMDIRTMDRFDDPKGKTITISSQE